MFNPFATSSSKFRQTPRKLQIWTSFTINFSSNSDKYSMICGQLKIKFHYRKFLIFKEICEFHSARATLFRVKFGSFDGIFADSEAVLKVGSKHSNVIISKILFKVTIQLKSCTKV